MSRTSSKHGIIKSVCTAALQNNELHPLNKNRELQALAEENRVRLLQEQSARAELEAILTTMTDGVIVFDDSGGV